MCHILSMYVYLLLQKFPSYCGVHSQVATPFISLHVPEFWHGFGEQGFASVNMMIMNYEQCADFNFF